METKNVKCECGKSLEYWTKKDSIACPTCKATIKVEPCEDEVVEEVKEETDEEVETIEIK